jgi:hypothetical protein
MGTIKYISLGGVLERGPSTSGNGLLLSCENTYLHVFQTILLANTSEDILLAAFLHLAGEEELIEDEVCLLEVENDIQFAHIAIIFVHLLDETMHNFQSDELVVSGVYPGDEEKRGVAAINDLGVFAILSVVCRGWAAREWWKRTLVLEEIAHSRATSKN